MARGMAVSSIFGVIDQIYAIGDGTSHDRAGPLLAGLHRVLDFSSGVTIRIDPASWTLQSGHAHRMDESTVRDYLAHYCTLDPYVTDLPCLKQPNTVIRWSDSTNIRQLARSEFGQFMREVDYFHCLAVVPFSRALPLGVYSIHRTAGQRDFSESDRRRFAWFVRHLKNAEQLRTLQLENIGRPMAGWLVQSSSGKLEYLTEEAEAILGGISHDVTVPQAGAPPRFWRVRDSLCAVQSTALPAGNMFMRAGLSAAAVPQTSRWLKHLKLRTDSNGSALAVNIQPISNFDDDGEILAGSPFALQERRIALHLMRGRAVKEIAPTMQLTSNTVNEYIKNCYRKLGAHGRAEFMLRIGCDY